jgi:hypothetical protein
LRSGLEKLQSSALWVCGWSRRKYLQQGAVRSAGDRGEEGKRGREERREEEKRRLAS